MLGQTGIGARGQPDVRGNLGLRGPGLLAVDEPAIVLTAGLAVGLASTLFLLRDWREKTVLTWFCLGLACAAGAVLLDLVDFLDMGRFNVARRILEDCLELLAGAGFLLAFLRVLMTLPAPDPRSPESPWWL